MKKLVYLGVGAVATASLIGYSLGEKALKSLKEPPPYRLEDIELVSVVIPTYNEENYLPKTLQSLGNQTYQNLQVIIADYQSEDATRDIAKQYGCIVVNVDQKGIAIARNAGSKQAKGNILFHCDADCIFAHNTIEKLVSDVHREGVACAHGFNILYEGNPFNRAIMVITSIAKPSWWSSGRSITVWRDVFWKLEGFKNIIGEDREFGLRLKREGYKIIYDYGAIVGTSDRRVRKYGWLVEWDSVKFVAVRDSIVEG